MRFLISADQMATPKTTHTMPIGKAAEILGVTPGHLHNLDRTLQPVRDRFRRRWFDPAIVARVAAERAASKSTR
jgi:hypothetical protein